MLKEGGVWNTCKFDPLPNNNAGQLSPANFADTVAMMYYITEDFEIVNNNGEEFFNNGIQNPASYNTGNGVNTYYHRIGSESHKSGTITLSYNLKFPPPVLSSYPGQSPAIQTPVVSYYYRYVGESQWRELPRSIEKNRVGKVGYTNAYFGSTGNEIASPFQDEPQYDVYDETEVLSNNTRFLKNATAETIWAQTVRAYDYNDFNNVDNADGIEYAILFQDFYPLYLNQQLQDRAVAWLVADDFNYPKCIPWQGANAVVQNGSQINTSQDNSVYELFKFYKSDGSNNSTDYKEIETPSPSNTIWGRNAYGDYNDQFYTDNVTYTPYLPVSSETQFINVRLERGLPGLFGTGVPFTLTPWTTPGRYILPGISIKAINLQWVLGIDTVTGVKLSNTNATTGAKTLLQSSWLVEL